MMPSDDDPRARSPPSLLQRIASFIDSPCSSLGISSSTTHESPLRSRSTSQVNTRQLPSSDVRSSGSTQLPRVVTPIKSTPSPKAARPPRRVSNRSHASRQVRQAKLNALLNNEEPLQTKLPSQPPTLRRTKSLQATPSPTSVAAADSAFWSEPTAQFEAAYCRPIQACCATSDSPDSSTLQDNWSILSSRGWCCADTTYGASLDNNQSLSTSQVCDGYIDYVGQHHPHTPTNCQGCIFRQSIFDASGDKGDDELYYDSDCELYARTSAKNQEEVAQTPRSHHTSHASYSPPRAVDDQQSLDLSEDSCSPDRRAYMYDYFTRNQQQQLMHSPLRTGVNATSETDIAAYVQEALNTTWKLAWHTTSATDSRSAFLPHPKPCNVWIERGYRRNMNQAVEPRLMWREAKAHTSYAELMERPNSLSLLAIRRIVPGEQVAESFIFTKANCMIIVKSSVCKDYCFEAESCSERDNIIHLWKMTTARLVSYAATQNTELMVEEFFNEYSVH